MAEFAGSPVAAAGSPGAAAMFALVAQVQPQVQPQSQLKVAECHFNAVCFRRRHSSHRRALYCKYFLFDHVAHRPNESERGGGSALGTKSKVM